MSRHLTRAEIAAVSDLAIALGKGVVVTIAGADEAVFAAPDVALLALVANGEAPPASTIHTRPDGRQVWLVVMPKAEMRKVWP